MLKGGCTAEELKVALENWHLTLSTKVHQQMTKQMVFESDKYHLLCHLLVQT